MPNTQQNNIQNEIQQIKKEIDLFKTDLGKRKNSESISKWVNAHQKNTTKKRTKDGSFSNQRNGKYSKDILQNNLKQIEKNTNLLQNILTQVKKRKRDNLKKN